MDAAILANRLKSEIWHDEVFQEWAWDPNVYNGLAGNALYLLMARDFAPLPDRLRAAASRMTKLPAIFEQARAQLVPARVPAIHAQTVAKQNKGMHTIIDDQILAQAAALLRRRAEGNCRMRPPR